MYLAAAEISETNDPRGSFAFNDSQKISPVCDINFYLCFFYIPTSTALCVNRVSLSRSLDKSGESAGKCRIARIKLIREAAVYRKPIRLRRIKRRRAEQLKDYNTTQGRKRGKSSPRDIDFSADNRTYERAEWIVKINERSFRKSGSDH